MIRQCLPLPPRKEGCWSLMIVERCPRGGLHQNANGVHARPAQRYGHFAGIIRPDRKAVGNGFQSCRGVEPLAILSKGNVPAIQACVVHHQRKSHVRSDLWRCSGRRRRSFACFFPAIRFSKSSRACGALRIAGEVTPGESCIVWLLPGEFYGQLGADGYWLSEPHELFTRTM